MTNLKKTDFKLFRCIFLKSTKNYIKAKDYNGNKYMVKKSSSTKRYKKGLDDTFYAKLELKGFVIKKKILHVINYEDYLKLAD